MKTISTLRCLPSVFLLAITSAIHLSAGAADLAANDAKKLPPPAEREVDYAQDIQPLLANACYFCHGPEKQEAGLRLDQKKGAFTGGDSGPAIVVGKSAESRLIQLVAGMDEEAGRMPPEDSGEALTSLQIGLLRKWIDGGANWPDHLVGSERSAEKPTHWSLRPIEKPKVPQVQNEAWVRNPIDSFILEKLDHEGVAPSPEAEPVTLVRRVYLDLIGLPPSTEEVDAFLADRNPDAYERVVDRLLESPHFGERWGRHWLDAARYADSDGYEKDLARPFAWRYRDWVIHALNRDLPFDKFTVQQLAGDLLQPGDAEYDSECHIATGFHRNTMFNREAGIDPEEDRVKRTVDRTNTTGSVWMGLSLGCANCHTHKYDSISQREYFQMYAFFNNLREVDVVANFDGTIRKGARDKEQMLVQEVAEERRKRRETYIHLRGDFLSEGQAVEPNTPAALPPLISRGKEPDRLDLARWLVDVAHPLTARVAVNRIWHLHFGRGLYATLDDFGTRGENPCEIPSHPELLDWLASEFRDGGWKVKEIHRLIVTSATYRQSSLARPELLQRDPYNTWLARQNRFRVEAEIVRDLMLSAGGLLNRTVGGPSIRPPQPTSIMELTYSGEKDDNRWIESSGPDRYRRGMYIWFQRTSPYHSLNTFDAPESSLFCVRRERSNSPLQALTLLNDIVFFESAESLGRAVITATADAANSKDVVEGRIRAAWRHSMSREPSAEEIAVLHELYRTAQTQFRENPAAARLLLKAQPPNETNYAEIVETAACVVVARAIMNLDEFVTRE